MDLALDQPDLFPIIERKATHRSALWQLIETFRREGPCVTPAMVAAAIGVSPQRIQQLTSAGRIPTVVIGRRTMIPLAALELFLTEERKGGRRADYQPPETFGQMLKDLKKNSQK